MSTSLRVVAFLAALAAVFGVTVAAGRAFGPVEAAPAHEDAPHGSSASPGSPSTPASPAPGGTPGSGAGASAGPSELPGGLQVSQEGYTLRLLDTDFPAGPRTPVRLLVEGPTGTPVLDYVPQHEKELHLIAVRRDFSGFQHVHPTRGADGVWSTTLALTPGSWRVFADMAPRGGNPLTLGADLSVAGTHQPVAAPEHDVRTTTVDGYTVTLEGDLTPGTDSGLTLAVSRAGKPVTDLDPYLGAYGHLVALRTGDLAYLHVHPEGHPGDGTTAPGPEITFGTAVPSPGTYRLFLDFRHEGVVRTAAFTVTAGFPANNPSGGSSDHAH